MNNQKQRLLIEYLISSPDLWAQCAHIISSKYWDPEFRDTIEFIQSYQEEYQKIPNPDKILAETGVTISLKEITGDTIEWCANEIEIFCKNKAIEAAARKIPRLMEKKNWGAIENEFKEALTISLHRNLGLDYFDDPEYRLKKMKEQKDLIKTGWKTVDYSLFGGIKRGELLIFAGESGAGKSMSLLNLARNFLEGNLSGIYYSLELSEEVIARRLDSMMSGYAQTEIIDYIDQIAMSISMKKGTMGNFVIKQFPASTTSTYHIRSHLAEFKLKYDWKPDFIIVDYLDLMIPNAKVALDNLFVKDKFVSEELRSLAVEYNFTLTTASQLNRSAIDQDRHSQSMIAGGISKINTADNVISIKQTDKMRATGEISFQFLKTRSSNAVGKIIFLSWDPNSLLIRDDLSGRSKSHEEEKPLAKKGKASDLLGVFEDAN